MSDDLDNCLLLTCLNYGIMDQGTRYAKEDMLFMPLSF